jgi:diguanylate cyclase
LQQLQSLAVSVAAQVGQHNERVQEINSELTTGESHTSESVMAVVARLIEANARMQDQLADAEQRLEAQAKEIESHVSEARTDALTRVNNRRAFDEEMQKCVEAFRSQGRSTSVMLLDVDFFKRLNDKYGHSAGDEVLKSVAATLKARVSSDDIVCRYGGEEFTIIFPGTSLSLAHIAAERARAAIGAASLEIEGRPLHVTASVGLAEMRPGETAEEVLKRADEALYVSKRDGRDCGHYHDGVNFVRFVPRATAVEQSPKRGDAEPTPEPPASAGRPPEIAVEKDDKSTPVLTNDPCTGLSNRGIFLEDLNRRMSEWKRGGVTLSIVLMRVDEFKGLGGDDKQRAQNLVLRACTQFLRATMRNMDHIARFADDTFVILMPTASLANAVGVAERLRNAVGRCHLPFRGSTLGFTATFGVGEATKGDGAQRLLQRTQQALDAGVAAGGCCSYLHTGEHTVCADDYFALAESSAGFAGASSAAK